MFLQLTTFWWNALTRFTGTVTSYIYESRLIIALVSCVMAVVFIAHVRSAFMLLSSIFGPKPPKKRERILQSPIHIRSELAIRRQQERLLEWNCYNELPPAILLENDGHSLLIRISSAPDCVPYLSGGPLLHTYYFVEASFKWGPSEHRLDGHKYSMELQVLHATNAPDAPFEYLTVTYLFFVATEKNRAIETVVENLPSIVNAGSVIEIPPFDLTTLFPPFAGGYYSYTGTYINGNIVLQTQWFICSTVYNISPDQLEKFTTLLDREGENIRSNPRYEKDMGPRSLFLFF